MTRGKRPPEATLPQGTKRAPQSRDILGQTVGVSGRLIDQAKYGWQHEPERMRAIVSGASSETVSRVAREAQDRVGDRRTHQTEHHLHDSMATAIVRHLGSQPQAVHRSMQELNEALLAPYTLLLAKHAKVNPKDRAAMDAFVRRSPEVRAANKAFSAFCAALQDSIPVRDAAE